MYTERAGDLRNIQLWKSAEYFTYHVILIRLASIVKTRQVYILVNPFPAYSVSELVYFPRFPLFVRSLFEYGEAL